MHSIEYPASSFMMIMMIIIKNSMLQRSKNASYGDQW